MPEKDLNQRFRASEKLRFVIESAGLEGTEFGLFLRRYGISTVELQRWRDEMESGLNEGRLLDRGTKRKLEARIHKLEQLLREAEGVIELQKKVQNILAEDEEQKPQAKSADKSSKPSKT